jgi:serine O-acetyltransferase
MPDKNDQIIRDLVAATVSSYEAEADIIKIDEKNPISKDIIVDIIEKLQSLVFPGFFSGKPLKPSYMDYYVGELYEELIYQLEKQITRALPHAKPGTPVNPLSAIEITYAFLRRIPDIRHLLSTDTDAFFDGDPAAASKDEIILSYPGLYAVMVSRLAHELFILGVPLIPRMMSEHAHSLTGIDIHPGASIGHHFFIDHGTGIVVGETTIIGNHVKIYHGVTLGGLSTRGGQALSGTKRHPTIEDHVTIYSGASIFGGATIIGEGVVIGSNAFITKSVPERTRVSIKNPDLQYKSGTDKKSHSVELEQGESWFYVI